MYGACQFAELFIGQRQSYPDKELSLLRMRLTDALAHYAGDVGLNYPLEKKKKQRKTTGRKATKQLLQQGVAAAEQAETLPPLRIDRVQKLTSRSDTSFVGNPRCTVV